MEVGKFYIDGAWHNPARPHTHTEVINPATETIITQLPLGTEADVNKAVAAAKQAFPGYAKTSINQRLELLEAIRAEYKTRYQDLADAISMEMGAPKTLAENHQTAAGLGHLKAAQTALRAHKFEWRHGTSQHMLRYEAIGVAGLITPWNWPSNQIMAKLAPCLAAGCTAILKPSEVSPLSAVIIAEICHKAGVPKGVFNMVQGLGPVVGAALSRHPDVALMSFTGSTRAGVAVAQDAAATVKRVCQELGGKSANIILDDNAFATSVAQGTGGAMVNSGQSCTAPTRMLVPASRHEEALAIAKTTAESLVVGDPRDANTDLGPVANATQYDKVQTLIALGIDEGAKLVTGGAGRVEGLKRGYFVKPTVFGSVQNTMTIAREEIFGPVLSVLSYQTTEDAIAIANDSTYGLAGYVSGDASKNHKTMLAIARELQAGQIHFNYTAGGAESPFGGYKQSGNGRERGTWGLDEYLEIKAMLGVV